MLMLSQHIDTQTYKITFIMYFIRLIQKNITQNITKKIKNEFLHNSKNIKNRIQTVMFQRINHILIKSKSLCNHSIQKREDLNLRGFEGEERTPRGELATDPGDLVPDDVPDRGSVSVLDDDDVPDNVPEARLEDDDRVPEARTPEDDLDPDIERLDEEDRCDDDDRLEEDDFGVSGLSRRRPVDGDIFFALIGDFDAVTSTFVGTPHLKFSELWNEFLYSGQSMAIALSNLSVCATSLFSLTASANTNVLTPSGSLVSLGPPLVMEKSA